MKNDWTLQQIAKMNTLADDPTAGNTREVFDGIGGIFWVTMHVDGSERNSTRYKNARSALKAYMKANVQYSAIENLIPKNKGAIKLYVRRDCVLECTWREHAKLWL